MQIPSPLERFNYDNFSFLVKRDDLIDPFISGNKWRKLKYALLEAQQLNKNHLVTFGGAYSNHLLATAAAGAKFNFKTSAFVRGEAVNNEILFFCQLFGMKLHFISRDDYKNKEELFFKNFKNNTHAYFIDEGGAGNMGIKGCSEIIDELKVPVTDIFCAAGTGTTAIGILNALNKQYESVHLHIVPVLKNLNLNAQILAVFPKAKNFTIHDHYHFGGYAKTSPELINFIKKFTTETGLLIDPIYTGKMFFAMCDLMAQCSLKYDAKLLAIHTGGVLGSLGMMKKFNF